VTDNTNDDGPARFADLDRMASQLFGSTRWRTKFCQRYGISAKSTLTTWATKGPPQWALVAVRDALIAEAVRDALDQVGGKGDMKG
jgi:hypothetical protein